MLSKEETEYLWARVSTYVANNNQNGRQKKGAKGQWVIENILPDFKSHFQYSSKNMDGPRMDDITKVRFPFWFARTVGSQPAVEGQEVLYKSWQAWDHRNKEAHPGPKEATCQNCLGRLRQA